MKMRRCAALLFIGMLSLTQSISVQASMLPDTFQSTVGETSISPQWVNTNDVTLDLYFDSGDACCSGKIRALTGTASIDATFKLERKGSYGWIYEKSWSQSSKSDSLSFYGTDAVLSGYTYRLSVTAYVTRNGVTETVSTSVDANH